MTSHTWFLLFAVGFIGLLVGSFLNVVIYRLPLMMQNPTLQRFNLWLPRSHCPHCNTLIPAWHNIPLLSYCLLRGHCHACQHTIPYQYPLVEGLSMLLCVLAAYTFGYHLSLLFALFLIWLTIAMTFIDLRHQLLPDCLTLGLLWLGLLANTTGLFTTLPNAVWSAAGAYLTLWLFIQIFYLCTGKIGMGHGDFKLFAAFGAWFGWQAMLPILLTASISGTIVGVIYLQVSRQSKDTPIPFGPFLCLGGLCQLFTPVLKQF